MKNRAYEFQKLSARLISFYFLPSIAIVVLAVVLLLMSVPATFYIITFFVGFIWFFVGQSKHRCPNCNRILTDGDGLDFNPKKCGNCGIILKWLENQGASSTTDASKTDTKKYSAHELNQQCNQQAPMPADLEHWEKMPRVGREIQ